MGVGPSKEKFLELVKACSKTNNVQNNYKIEYQIDQDNQIYAEDDESLEVDGFGGMRNQNSDSIFRDIKDLRRFPYVSIGTITLKFPGNDNLYEHTCFLINKKVIVTLLSFLKLGGKNVVEATTTFTEEKLNLKHCVKYERKNLVVFFLNESSCAQWIGVEEYDKKNQKDGKIKAFYTDKIEKKEDCDMSASPFMEERNSLGGKNFSIKEINCDLNQINKYLVDKNELREKIIGGVICYKNKNNGGIYSIGIIDQGLKPNYFDQETLKFLYEQVYKAKLSNKEGIDESNIIEIDLSKRNIGPTAIKYLTEYNLINLKKLNLLKNQIGPQGAFYLGQSKFSNLEILILNFNEIGDEGMQYLSKGPFLGLKYLYLFHNNISNIGVGYIFDSIFIDTLLLLDLSDNPNINIDGISIIKSRIEGNNNVLKELLCLNLSATTINESALEILDKIKFPKLKKLIMQDIDFTKSKKIVDLLNKDYDLKMDGIV